MKFIIITDKMTGKALAIHRDHIVSFTFPETVIHLSDGRIINDNVEWSKLYERLTDQ